MRLKLSFALILISSALLLSAEESQKQSPNQPAKSEAEQATKNYETTQKIEPPPRQSSTLPTLPQVSKPAPDEEGNKGENEKAQNWWVKLTWDWMRLNADTIFNGLLVLYSFLLWWVTRRQVTLTEQAEETSRKSLEIAELALKADRPYLLIQKALLDRIMQVGTGVDGAIDEYKHFSPRAYFTFRNYGKGPALLEEAVIRLYPLPELQDAGDFTDCKKAQIDYESGREAIGVGEPWEISNEIIDSLISEPDYKEIVAGTKKITVWGQLKYRDVFNNPYETAFCWILEPPQLTYRMDQRPIMLIGRFLRGPATHNYAK
jgi:hypothetical protein